MSERPIIFSGESVRAILADRKTMTRRISGRYEVGDLLWVKEKWRVLASDSNGKYDIQYYGPTACVKWGNPLFMPKKFARIWLEVTAIRVERLQKISEEDVWAEGIEKDRFKRFDAKMWNMNPFESFQYLWNSLNARGYGWDTNPEVKVISFKRVSFL